MQIAHAKDELIRLALQDARNKAADNLKALAQLKYQEKNPSGK